MLSRMHQVEMEVAITSAFVAALNGFMSANVHGMKIITAAYRLKKLYQCLCRDYSRILACKQYSHIFFASSRLIMHIDRFTAVRLIGLQPSHAGYTYEHVVR